MRFLNRILLTLALTAPLLSSFALAADSPQFRGANRNGVFNETGLLRSWPADGLRELWDVDGLGEGYASISVAQNSIYTTGMKELVGSVFAFDMNGKPRWKTEYGKEHHGSGYPGSRSTPTVDGNRVYMISGMGRVVCLDAVSGDILWAVDTLERFGKGKSPDTLIPRWSIAESVLIDGDNLICTPGAPKATVVALNKHNGETVWTTQELSDLSGYCSAKMFDNGKLRQIITMTSKSMVGIDPATGKLLWRQAYPASWEIHAISPVFHGNLIYVSDGYRHGGKAFELAPDGKSLQLKWEEPTLDVHHGGVVAVDGYIYGAANKGTWICIDFKTGEVTNTIDGVGKGSVIYADGMLYGYGEKGKLGIIKASPTAMELVSSFEIEKGSGPHWGHPVISGGVLYIRHGDSLMAFSIKAG